MNITIKFDSLRRNLLNILNSRADSSTQQTYRVENIVENLTDMVNAREKVKLQQKILKSLIFDDMKQRQERIHKADTVTLSWIFTEPRTRFMEWLRGENGIYWVKGKVRSSTEWMHTSIDSPQAGSGKSTLMKFICEHIKTLGPLNAWASPGKLFTASHFFWHAGTPTQKSQKGLLQALLYQLLSATPDLMLEILAIRQPHEIWTRAELLETLWIVSEKTSNAKHCFFIDGLDEYDEPDEHQSGHKELIKVLQKICGLPNVKMCVSSRPWTVFEEAFGDSPFQMALEDLNHKDMENYVTKRLGQNALFLQKSKEDARCHDLVDKIVKRAHGVFLWIYLVVHDLLQDIEQLEDYPQLERRVEDFPPELEAFFEKILGRIEKVFRKETARIFLLTVEAVRPLPLVSLKFLIQKTQDPAFNVLGDLPKIDAETARNIFLKYKKLAFNRCRDLLEINIVEENVSGPRGVGVLGYEVDFLHRTVRDFLQDNYINTLRNDAGDDFNPTVFLCGVNIALLKSIPVSTDPKVLINPLFRLVDEAIYYAHQSELNGEPYELSTLDELDMAMASHTSHWGTMVHWTNLRDTLKGFHDCGQCTFLALAVQSRLVTYVNDKLSHDPQLLNAKRGRSLLDYALRPKRVTPAELPYRLYYDAGNIDVRMVKVLLSFGANCDQTLDIFEQRTVWQLFLSSCVEDTEKGSREVKRNWAETIALLIDAGADPHAKVSHPDMRVEEAIKSIFRHDGGDAEKQLISQLYLSSAAYQKTSTGSSIIWRILGWS
jgi:hypothetical protein